MRGLTLTIGFLKALWLAAASNLRHDGWAALPAEAFAVGRALLRVLFRRDARASANTVKARLDACALCPIYCADLQTCGDARLNELESMGCACFMPVKARLKEAVCWLREPEQKEALASMADTYGWPEVTK